jgi:deoxyribodipyrimidine photo-lyase
MTDKPIIVWFRNDLRIADNLALLKAGQNGAPIIAIYIYDSNSMGDWDYGAAQKYWLHHSLQSLKSDLKNLGIDLVLRKGDTILNLLEICQKTGAKNIYALRNYEPFAVLLENQLHEICADENIIFKRYAGNLLLEPELLKNKSGNYFQIFTPFFKALQNSQTVRAPCPIPSKVKGFVGVDSDNLDDWGFLPTKPNWAHGFTNKIGERNAIARLKEFLGRIENYTNGRDIPAQNSTSFLAPHLRFGEISPAQIWQKIYQETNNNPTGNYQKFLAELGWREFSYHLLTHNPKMVNRPLKSQFENFPWGRDENGLLAWQKGQTGYPIVDAGMRQLWETGYMHNRVRMIVASFLIKHLLIHWVEGAKWFWDCLLDGDLANNSAGWQWVAGCGSDAAPYFRIFNPITQGQKFDAMGDYVRKWVPELSKLPNEYIHFPKDAPIEVLARAGVILGRNYPQPIIDHKFARERALEALKETSNPV